MSHSQKFKIGDRVFAKNPRNFVNIKEVFGTVTEAVYKNTYYRNTCIVILDGNKFGTMFYYDDLIPENVYNSKLYKALN